MRPERDTERVIEMLKSGAVASAESLSRALVNTSHLKHSTNTIKKSKSFTKIPTEKDSSQSAYQNKRKLESKIEALEEEIAKGEEAKYLLNGFQIMFILLQVVKRCQLCS